MNIRKLIFLFVLIISALSSQIYQINLDDRPEDRYTYVSSIKKSLIQDFISYLKNNVLKYKIAFTATQILQRLSPKYLKAKIGRQFYQQCLSISKGTNIPISQIIVFNYMYQLGAATKFCTAITISTKNSRILGRNLDYGFQSFLAHNSLHFQYFSKGQLLFQTLGHAGFVGTHTAFKRATVNDQNSYAITLNQRIDGGLHKNIQKIIFQKCQTCPYTTMRALKYAKGDINEVFKYINKINTCSAVYWTVVSKNGGSYVIEKNRGVGSHYLRQSSQLNGFNYIIQTNHDSDVADPDGRSNAAQSKIKDFIQSYNSDQDQPRIKEQIWRVLTEKPNFNNLTLMTSLIDVQNAVIKYQIWNFTSF